MFESETEGWESHHLKIHAAVLYIPKIIWKRIAKRKQEDIFDKEWWNGYSMQALYDPDLKVEILNVRVATRLTRDKAQDTEDEKAGIYISYEADFAKAKKKWKQKRKEKHRGR